MSGDAIRDFLERLHTGISRLLEQLPVVVSDPRAYPREAMLLAVIVVLLLLLVVIAVLAIADADAGKARARRRALRRGIVRKTRWVRLAAIALALAWVAALIAFVPLIPQAGAACGTCHAVSTAVASWDDGGHAGVSCYACHAGGTVGGALSASASGVARALLGRSVVLRPGVDSNACLDCHADITAGVIGGAVRMRHSDVIEAGMSCVECHRGSGHEAGVVPSFDRKTMTVCLTCHDGIQASSACATCHPEHPLDAAGASPVAATPIEVTCSGCHSSALSERCTACHGVEMPHPAAFMGEHAGLSAARPAVCARCHDLASPGEGCGCHTEVNLHGTYSEWFPRHGTAAVASSPLGCNCHPQQFCAYCHTSDPFAAIRR